MCPFYRGKITPCGRWTSFHSAAAGGVRYTIMLEEFRYLLSPINVKQHPEWGAYIELIDYEHKDYIEYVLCEYFDLEYAFSSNEDDTGNYILYFAENAAFDSVDKAVNEINQYHKINNKEYKVAPYT